jgi:hypothetical protein
MKEKLKNPKLLAGLIIILLCMTGLISVKLLSGVLIVIMVLAAVTLIWSLLADLIDYLINKNKL